MNRNSPPRHGKLALASILLLAATQLRAASGVIEKGGIHFAYNDRGISGLASLVDPFKAPVTVPDQDLALSIRYKTGTNDWSNILPGRFQLEADTNAGSLVYTYSDSEAPVKVVQTFKTDGQTLDWTIAMEATTKDEVTIGDFAIDLPTVGPRGEEPKQIFERGFMRHQFIEGSGSFLYFVRASGAGPFLIVTVHPGTKLEYFGGARGGGGGGRGGGSPVYVHSGLSGGGETRGTWRQEHTFLKLGPKGAKNDHVEYGFRFQWAKSYDEMRDVLYREGLFDIRAVPGMTVPTDLAAKVALHTQAHIESLTAEFPSKTRITSLGESQPGYHIYEIAFSKLGENLVTIHHDGGRKTYLEYFVTEPLETLIKKRSSFIINRQQVHDPYKWWDGVFGPYDMKNEVVRTIDDPDIFVGQRVYSLTCDDPGLSKAPYVAEKNVSFPDQKEIEGLEYYLEHFVWGKLQRTDKETPYPYGVYGTPNWYIDRNPEFRTNYAYSTTNRTAIKDLVKEHVWRSYDYPHVVMFYFHMYEIAKKYPQMMKYLDAAGYLERAYQTARAFYIYPYEIYPEYYETYKWGLYNELVVLKLADALDREGLAARATWLRSEWEKKVKYFVYDDPYPFRSEYAFDRTAFESTYALAKYGATHDMKPDTNLWHDAKLGKDYSHPEVKREDSRAFMERQLAAGLCVRGWLETSYYQLGADGGLSYMAAMGGWGILDYAENFSTKPYDWLGLGYASYLSSWCLVNSGTPESNYGYWFPGKANDGAAGWQFTSGKVGNAWMASAASGGRGVVPRGPWQYDGEIDLGYCGALRMAATVVTRDPIFDWLAYGGALTVKQAELRVIPRDGLRQRFIAMVGDSDKPDAPIQRLKVELDRDGFAAEQPVIMDEGLGKLTFQLEDRTKDAHISGLWLSWPEGMKYTVMQDGKPVKLGKTGNWDHPWMAELKLSGGPSKIEITRATP